MKKRIIAILFLITFGFILLFKSISIEVQAAEPTFRLISAERNASFDQYTFSCSTKGYGLGWPGPGNESYLVINDTIELKATSAMSSSTYTSFIISDSGKKLNSKITKMKFTNVLELNSSNTPSGSMSGNPDYDISFSNASFKGFSFYSSSSDTINTASSEFSFDTIKQYLPLGIYFVVWLLTVIASLISINKITKEKVLTFKTMKSAYRTSILMFIFCVIAWFSTSVITMINFFENNRALGFINLLGGFALNAISYIIIRSIIGSKINKKANSVSKLKIGMTRNEITNVLEVELNNDNTINVIKPYLNGSQTINYSLTFDENNKLINVESKSTKRWTETRFM